MIETGLQITSRLATPDDVGRVLWHAFATNCGCRITTVSANGRLVFGLPVKKNGDQIASDPDSAPLQLDAEKIDWTASTWPVKAQQEAR